MVRDYYGGSEGDQQWHIMDDSEGESGTETEGSATEGWTSFLTSFGIEWFTLGPAATAGIAVVLIIVLILVVL